MIEAQNGKSRERDSLGSQGLEALRGIPVDGKLLYDSGLVDLALVHEVTDVLDRMARTSLALRQ
jgi:hypothetical protein